MAYGLWKYVCVVALYVYTKNVQIAENTTRKNMSWPMGYGSMYVYLVIMHTVGNKQNEITPRYGV
jgi:hypothetical protein